MKSEVIKTPMSEGEYRSPKAKVLIVEMRTSVLSGSYEVTGEAPEPEHDPYGDI